MSNAAADHFFAANVSTELTADLTTTEITSALAGLRFHGDEVRLVALDRGVRDHIVAVLSAGRRK